MGVQQHWSTTPSTNATADSAVNLAENQAPSTLNDAARAVMAQVKKTVSDISGGIVTAGSATAFTVTTNEVITALSDGLVVVARAHTASGASPTLSVDGLTAKAIRPASGVAAYIGMLISGGVYTFTYDNTNGYWVVSGGPPISRFIGESIILSTATLPPLCLWEDGSAVSRTTYAALFAVIGTQFGAGNGSTTFNLPDNSGRFIAGRDMNASGRLSTISGTALGATGGSQTHTLSTTEIPFHQHTATLGVSASGSGTSTVTNIQQNTSSVGAAAGGNFTAGPYNPGGISVSVSVSGTAAGTTDGTGSGGAHNNLPPTLTKNIAIFAGA